jgi:hypothetical protein
MTTTEETSAPDTAETDGKDRRRAARQTLVAKAMLFPQTVPARPQSIYLCNISHFGIGFRTPQPFETGDRYRIRIEAGPMRMASHVEVVSCRPRDAQSFEVGAAFVRNELDFDRRETGRRAESIPRNPSRDLVPHS